MIEIEEQPLTVTQPAPIAMRRSDVGARRNDAAGAVDFSHVPSHQDAIHDRLINWARWCQSGAGRGKVLPMFQGYRDNYWEIPAAKASPINVPDAVMVQKTMAHVPEKHRLSVQWCYVYRNSPMRVCQALGVSRDGLMRLINDGRDMVKNRLCVAGA